MFDAYLFLEKTFEEAGIHKKYEARGEARSRQEIAQKLKDMGLSEEQITEATGLSV